MKREWNSCRWEGKNILSIKRYSFRECRLSATNPFSHRSQECEIQLPVFCCSQSERRRRRNVESTRFLLSSEQWMIFHSSPINFCHFLTSSDESQGNEVSSEDLVFRFESLLHLDQKLSFPCILSLDWTRHISLDRQTFSGTRKPRYCDRCSFPNWANHIDQTHQRICTHSSCCRSMWPVARWKHHVLTSMNSSARSMLSGSTTG